MNDARSQCLSGDAYITYMDNIDNTSTPVNAITKFKSNEVKNWAKTTGEIINVDSETLDKHFNPRIQTTEESTKKVESAKYHINVNGDMIMIESKGLELVFGGNTGKLLALIITIVVLTSVFCIKNSFDISISEKIKQYSILKSVGATKKQIRKNIFFEASILGLIGIPLGILVGLLPLNVFVKIYNKYFMDSYIKGLKIDFEFSFASIIIAIIMGTVTIFLSALSIAIKTSKLNILTGIRNSSNIKIKAKKLKTPKFIQKTFGIGGELSYKNLKRNKKKYRTTILSIIVSVIIIITLSSFMTTTSSLLEYTLKIQEYNIDMRIDECDDELNNKLTNATKLDTIKDWAIIKNLNFASKDLKDLKKFDELDGGVAHIYSIGTEQYKKYINKLGLNYNDVKNKAIAINTFSYDEFNSNGEGIKKQGTIDLKNGQNISCRICKEYPKDISNPDDIKKDFKDISLNIAYTTDKKPFGMPNYANPAVFFIVSNEFYDEFDKDFTSEIEVKFDSSDPDKLEKDLKALLNDNSIDIDNAKESIDQSKNLMKLTSLFSYSFIAIIILIGLTSIFNTITTSVELRKQEFATLKSVGMTKKEFNRMIGLETLFMGAKALIFSLPIGIGLSYIVFYFIVHMPDDFVLDINYKLPIVAIISVIIAVFMLISIIMKYSISKTNKQNIIETIRNENI